MDRTRPQIQLLGGLELRVGGRVLLDRAWNRSKAKALIKLLALQPQHALNREQVLDTLWPELDSSAAINNLHKNLHYIRETLRTADATVPLLLPSDALLQIAPDWQVDVDIFRDAGREARRVRTNAELYADAIALYGGELLPEDLSEDWTANARERLRDEYCALLYELATLHEARSESGDAASRFKQLLDADSTREDAHRALMRLHATAGDLDAVRRQFRACRDALLREMDAAPLPETEQLYAAIMSGKWVVEPLGLRPPESRMVGRQREFSLLQAALEDAARGRGGIAILEGEAGVGKTRLAEELATFARLKGMQVLWGRCYEDDAAAPYEPWVQLVRASIATNDRTEARLASSGIGRVVPELAPATARAGPVGDSGRKERHALFQEITEFIRRAARRRPTLLVIEDLHDADAASLDLLESFARELRDDRMLVLVTYRDREPHRRDALANTLGAIERERVKARVALRGLDSATSGELMRDVAAAEPSPAFVSVVHRETNGNPFFIREVVRLLVAEGPAASLPDDVEGLQVPASVRDVIHRRLARLSPACRSTLAATAVIGRAATMPMLRSLAGSSAGDVVSAVQEAVSAGLINRIDGPSGRFEPSHALVRRAIYEDLPPAECARLHRAASALLAEAAGSDAAALVQIAHHLIAAARIDGDIDEAIDAAMRAGEAARSVFAWGDTISVWESAIQLMDASGVGEQRVAGLLERTGDLIVNTFGRYPAGIAHLERALAIRDRLGEPERAARIRVRLGLALATDTGNPDHARHMDFTRALGHYRAAGTTLDKEQPSSMLGYLYVGLANAAFNAARVNEGLEASSRAVEIAREIANESLLASALLVHGVLLKVAGRMSEGLVLLDEARAISDRRNDTLISHYAVTSVADWHEGYAFGRGDVIRDALRQSRIANSPSQRSPLLQDLACALCLNGEVAEARAIGEECSTPNLRAMLHLCDGEWAEAETVWREGHEDFLQVGSMTTYLSRTALI
ncbi:MAG TPA: AAA family ATPase, partial [Dehalococcoidia bacterium]